MFSLQFFVFVFFLTGNLLGLVYDPDIKNHPEANTFVTWALNKLMVAIHSRNYDEIRNLLHADFRYKGCDSIENRETYTNAFALMPDKMSLSFELTAFGADNTTTSLIVFKAVFTAKMDKEERTSLVQMTFDKNLRVFTQGETLDCQMN